MRQPFRWMYILVSAAGFALPGCSNNGSSGQLVGPDDDNTISANPLAKAAFLPASAYRTDVAVQITNADGTPAAGLEVVFSRSISGRVSGDTWTGTTDTDGQAEIGIAVPTGRFWKTGATGYYHVRAIDPASGQTVGRWNSIPVNSRSENILSLPIGGRAKIHPRGPRVTVMTRSLYLGADINRILAPSDPEVPIPVRVAQTWSVVQQTNFPERARAIADEIAEARPHLVGLQEVSLFRIQNPGDILAGNPEPATEVAIDYLAILLSELEARGLRYRAVAIAEGIDIELPMATGATTPLADIRMTDREVILARSGVRIDNVVTKQFQATVPLTVGGVPTEIPRAWASVEATVAGRTLRFATTHLEVGAIEPIQRLQAGELLGELSVEPLPTILLGDFNSDANGTGTQTYGDLIGAGLVDVWNVANPDENGFTGSQAEDLLNTPSALSKRIDLIFVRNSDGFRVLKAHRVGEDPSNRTPSGLWPSDHAGVVASLRLPAVRLFARR